MGRPPLRVLLVCPDDGEGGPRGASYLEMLLGMHDRFQVTRGDDCDLDGGSHDAVLISSASLPLLSDADSADIPVIIVPRWHPDAAEIQAMVEGGAEDVLPLAELNGARLEAAVRKAVSRRIRQSALRAPLREALAGAATPYGVGLSGWSGPQAPSGPSIVAQQHASMGLLDESWVEA